jgi:tetratricopeptide (TPR) repeat protein
MNQNSSTNLKYEENEKIQTLGLMNKFITEHDYKWNHQDWLDYLTEVRNNGIILMSDDEIGKLLEDEREIMLMEKGNNINWTSKGISLLEQGRNQEAIAYFDKAINKNIQDTTAWFNKGYCLNQINEFKFALACFEKVLEINPTAENSWMAWTMKGICLKSLGLLEEAIYCYNKALSSNRNDYMALYNKGCILMDQGNHEEAFQLFKRTVELGSNPNYINARFNAGRCLITLGRHKEAAKYLG